MRVAAERRPSTAAPEQPTGTADRPDRRSRRPSGLSAQCGYVGWLYRLVGLLATLLLMQAWQLLRNTPSTTSGRQAGASAWGGECAPGSECEKLLLLTASPQLRLDNTQPPPRLDLAALGRKHMLSRFAEGLNASEPLPEYPRPQMQRARWLSLNGWWEWQQAATNLSRGVSLAHRILVPFAAEAPLSGLSITRPVRHMRYRRSFLLPVAWRVCGGEGEGGGEGGDEGGGGVLLHFGAVDWRTDVFVNGRKAGSHRGGYAPFSLDISAHLLRPTATTPQWVEVDVVDETEEHGQPVGKQRRNSPRHIWYTAVSGIWQTVRA